MPLRMSSSSVVRSSRSTRCSCSLSCLSVRVTVTVSLTTFSWNWAAVRITSTAGRGRLPGSGRPPATRAPSRRSSQPASNLTPSSSTCLCSLYWSPSAASNASISSLLPTVTNCFTNGSTCVTLPSDRAAEKDPTLHTGTPSNSAENRSDGSPSTSASGCGCSHNAWSCVHTVVCSWGGNGHRCPCSRSTRVTAVGTSTPALALGKTADRRSLRTKSCRQNTSSRLKCRRRRGFVQWVTLGTWSAMPPVSSLLRGRLGMISLPGSCGPGMVRIFVLFRSRGKLSSRLPSLVKLARYAWIPASE
mmetsp:Transcript_9172/g.19978  ORF Transcript_9172/g.19978 Transcript_9172/m.19978 type:complete len:303 (+) Transcript_9172:334-1242(+)